MQALIDTIKAMQPHPFVDHFTVALIVIGVLTDLVASLIPSRLWIRYMALSLMILGAGAAACSNLTGGWEAHRVRPFLQGPALEVLHTHAELGDILPWVFGGLAVWRLGVEFIGFLHGSRPLYLIAAVLGLIAIIYQGYKGGELVYDYGVGTMLMPTPGASSSPGEAMPTPEAPPPTPTVAPATPTPTVAPATPTLAPTVSAATATPLATATPSPAATPGVSPSSAPGTPVNPPPGEGSAGGTPAPHDL